MNIQIKTLQKIFLVSVLFFTYFFVTGNFVLAATIDRTSYGTNYSDNTSTNFSVKGGVGGPVVGRSKSVHYIVDNGLTMDLSAMTMTVPASIDFGVVTPGVPATVEAGVAVHMVGARNGYFLQVQRNNATNTLSLAADRSVAFPDATDWDPSGSGNAATSTDQNLSFRVMQSSTTANYNSVWWGSSDSDGVAKYAGFPAASQQFMACPSCNFGFSTTTIGYRVTTPIFQKNGAYDGVVTITALVNP